VHFGLIELSNVKLRYDVCFLHARNKAQKSCKAKNNEKQSKTRKTIIVTLSKNSSNNNYNVSNQCHIYRI